MNDVRRFDGRAEGLLSLLLCLGALLLGFLLSRGHVQHALLVYLASWMFVLAIPLGSVSLLLVHVLTGGEWGDRLRVQLRAAAGIFRYAAVALIPLLLGMHALFPWLQPGAGAVDPDLQRQRWYLNATGLVLRTLACLLSWQWLVYRLTRKTPHGVSPACAAGGLIAMLVTVSCLAVDWVMSLVPRWHSTDVGLLVFSSQLLIAFALAVLVQSGLHANAAAAPPGRLRRDFGNVLLAMVLGWGYVSFMDYLTAWIADLPAETAWYLPRVNSGWWVAGVVLAILGVGVPFFALLSARAKSSRRVLIVIALVTLSAQAINAAWLILPGVVAQGNDFSWGDPFLCAGLLGLCVTRYRALLMVEDQAS